MFGLFNGQNRFKAALQVYNGLALCLAAYDWFNNPAAKSSELGADIIIHAVSMYSLRENAGALLQLFSSGANCFRVGNIYTALTLGGSAVPAALNAIDAITHLTNAVTAFIPSASDNELEEDDALKAKMS